MLFDNLLNISIIISRVKDMLFPASMVERRILGMATDVNKQQIFALKLQIFSAFFVLKLYSQTIFQVSQL